MKADEMAEKSGEGSGRMRSEPAGGRPSVHVRH
jgi:hypothetical protein